MTLLQKRIEEARIERGYTQNELADRIGISYRTVLRWKLHGRYPQDMVLHKLVELKIITEDEAKEIKHERYTKSKTYAKLKERVAYERRR